MHIRAVGGETPNTVNPSVVRTRRYLTGREVEKLIEAARKHGRYGHRDATMILLAYRHGLRASELCDLQWHQVELNTGRLHVRRSKRGTPSVHPMQGDEIRALWRLQREQEAAPYVFTTCIDYKARQTRIAPTPLSKTPAISRFSGWARSRFAFRREKTRIAARLGRMGRREDRAAGKVVSCCWAEGWGVGKEAMPPGQNRDP